MAGSWEGLVKCRLKQHKVLLLFSWPFTLFHIHFGYSKSGKNSTTKHPTVTNQNSSTRNGLLLLCDKTFPGEMLHTYLFTPDRDPMTDQSMMPPKTNLVNPFGLKGLFMTVCAVDYLQEQKWLKDKCITKAHPSLGDSPQMLETWIVLHSLYTVQPVKQWPFQVAQLVCFFQAVWLI